MYVNSEAFHVSYTISLYIILECILLLFQVVTFSFASEDSAAAPNPDDGNPLRDLRFCRKQEPWKAISVRPEQVHV